MNKAPCRAPSRSAFRRPVRLRLAAAVGLALVSVVPVGCVSTPEMFSHRFHRQAHRLADAEIRGLQFFISSQVLGHTESGNGAAPAGRDVILVKHGTPAVVTELGPSWIRVGFREGSKGIPFLADPQSATSGLYYLATTQPGSKELVRVKDVPGHMATYDGVRYKIALGSDAILSCEQDSLQALLDKRAVQGLTR